MSCNGIKGENVESRIRTNNVLNPEWTNLARDGRLEPNHVKRTDVDVLLDIFYTSVNPGLLYQGPVHYS
jgi:hypothetical protein